MGREGARSFSTFFHSIPSILTSLFLSQQRSVLIPEGSPAGYGKRGLGEIPPNGGFELRVEVLEVVKAP